MTMERLGHKGEVGVWLLPPPPGGGGWGGRPFLGPLGGPFLGPLLSPPFRLGAPPFFGLPGYLFLSGHSLIR